jgi:imidazolonepropionase-like amidohydrolase
LSTTVLTADRLIDGTGAAPLDDPVVVVTGGTVTEVFQGRAPEGSLPADAITLDYRGCTLLPGLIDAHVHLNFSGDGTSLEELMREPDGVLVAAGAYNARRALEAGITTVRDTGCRQSTAFELRRALDLGIGVGPRLLACGQPITITGGHTWYMGGVADGEDALRRKVRDMCKLGADAIKVMASGGGTLNTISWLPSFRPAELAAIVDEAHRLNRKVTAHALCAEAIESAVAAGVDQLEHAGFIADEAGHQVFDAAVAEKVAAAGVPVTSTLSVGGFVVKTMEGRSERTEPEQALLDRWDVMLEENLEQFRQMRAAGVDFVAGTDAGWRFTPFDGLPEELVLMERGGMSALEAITSGTGGAAVALGIDGQVGTVCPGRAADLIAVDGNPLADLNRLRDLRLVLQGGRIRMADGALRPLGPPTGGPA